MPAFVNEIMNSELLSVWADQPAGVALELIRRLEVHSAPVVGEGDELLGMLSLGDLVGELEGVKVRDRMSSCAVITIPVNAPIEVAARTMTDADIHHAAVTDESGKPVGFLSILDVTRALIGRPTRHPSTFPHFDAATDLEWSDDLDLSLESLDHVPEAAGLYVLFRSELGRPDRVVWAESVDDLRGRLKDLIANAEGPFAQSLARGELRARVSVSKATALDEAYQALSKRILEGRPPPPA